MATINYQPGDAIQGFSIERIEEIPEIDGVAYIMRHDASGAGLLYLNVPDDEKGFAIAFKTPPADNTGVFHILEHSVLCGSDKYPVKEPFVHLLKSSMKTFLNAATGPNYTVFPVASTNEKDLMNLMSVYLDAVFHPAILHEPRIFQQEGWHYETDGENLSINGVVYNEVKGSMSNPSQMLLQAIKEEMFPDTAFRFESGGTPEGIASLDYDQFIDAYLRHYRPDNSAMMLYGELDLEAMLAMIGEACSSAAAACSTCEVGKPNQTGEQTPVISTDRVVHAVASPYEAQIAFTFVDAELGDLTRDHAVSLLNTALFGIEGAPIRKMLLESGLAMDVFPAHVPGTKRTVAIVAQGVMPDSKQQIFDAMRGVCTGLLETGIDRKLLEAALFSVEFHFRTGGLSGKPDATTYLITTLSRWASGLPLSIDYARYEDDVEFFRRAFETDYFERLMQEVFLENDHYAVVELIPDMSGEVACTDADELAALAREMGPEGLAQVKQQAEDLKAFQDRPESPEDLAKLPRLDRADCGEAPKHSGSHDEEVRGHKILRYDFADKGVAHIARFYDTSAITLEDSQYLSILDALISASATKRHNAQEVELLRVGRLGSLQGAMLIQEDLRDSALRVGNMVYSCSFSSDIEFAADYVSEVLHETLFDDRAKLREEIDSLFFQAKAMVVDYSPQEAAATRCSAHFSRTHTLVDMQQGIELFRFISELKARCEDDAEADKVLRRLKVLCARVFGTEPVFYGYAGDDETLERFFVVEERCIQEGKALAEKILSDLTEKERTSAAGCKVSEVEPLGLGDEAFVIPDNIAHCAVVYDCSDAPTRKSGSWAIANKVASLDYLWNEVRVKGGAYGAAFAASVTGLVTCKSFRDPSIDETIKLFDKTAEWLSEAELSQEELDGYVISSVASYDQPEKGIMRILGELGDYLKGWRKDSKATRREEMLATQLDDIHRLGADLSEHMGEKSIVVFASREMIEQSSHEFTVVDLLAGDETPLEMIEQ